MSENEKPVASAGGGGMKISVETARGEVQKLLDYYELSIDEIEDETMRNAIKQGYDRLVKAVRLGRLMVDTGGNGIQVVQELRSSGQTIMYREIDGNAKTAMAGKKADDHYGKAYSLMGSLSGLGEAAIRNLKGVDLSLAEVLGLIFLSV